MAGPKKTTGQTLYGSLYVGLAGGAAELSDVSESTRARASRTLVSSAGDNATSFAGACCNPSMEAVAVLCRYPDPSAIALIQGQDRPLKIVPMNK